MLEGEKILILYFEMQAVTSLRSIYTSNKIRILNGSVNHSANDV